MYVAEKYSSLNFAWINGTALVHSLKSESKRLTQSLQSIFFFNELWLQAPEPLMHLIYYIIISLSTLSSLEYTCTTQRYFISAVRNTVKNCIGAQQSEQYSSLGTAVT